MEKDRIFHEDGAGTASRLLDDGDDEKNDVNDKTRRRLFSSIYNDNESPSCLMEDEGYPTSTKRKPNSSLSSCSSRSTTVTSTFRISLIMVLFLVVSIVVSLPQGIMSAAVLAPAPSSSPSSAPFLWALLNHTKKPECFFPLSGIVSFDSPSSPTNFSQSVNNFCNGSSISVGGDIRSPFPKEVALCVMTADMVDWICSKTLKYQQKGALKGQIDKLNGTLNTLMEEAKGTDVTQIKDFCSDLVEGLPRLGDIRNELTGFYSNFISTSGGITKEGTNGSEDFCPKRCVKASTPLPVVEPICIVLKVVSTARKAIDGLGIVPNGSDTAVSPSAGGGQGQKESVDSVNFLNGSSDPLKKPIELAKKKEGNEKVDANKTVDGKNNGVAELGNNMSSSSSVGPLSPVVGMDGSSSTSSARPLLGAAADIPPPLSAGDNLKSSSPTPIPEKKEGSPSPQPPLLPPSSSQDKKKGEGSNKDTVVEKPDVTGQEDETPTNYDDDDSVEVPFKANSDKGNKDEVNKIPSLSASDTGVGNTNKGKGPVYTNDISVSKEDSGGGYFTYFIFAVTILALCFLLFHNKRRVLAYIVEGKRPRGGTRSRRRSTSAPVNTSGPSYSRLENQFDE